MKGMVTITLPLISYRSLHSQTSHSTETIRIQPKMLEPLANVSDKAMEIWLFLA